MRDDKKGYSARMPSRSGQGDGALQKGEEDESAIGATYLGFTAPLRVGHHPQHIPPVVDDASNIVQGTVGVRLWRDTPLGVAVAEKHLAVTLLLGQGVGVGVIASLPVGDGNAEHLPRSTGRGKGGGRVLYP